MKNIIPVLLLLVLASCNKIPDKPIWEELTTDELAAAIEQKPDFAEFYEAVQKVEYANELTDVQKAKYKDITWRRFFDMDCFIRDTAYFSKKREKWSENWEKVYGHNLAKVDSVLDYWKKFKVAHPASSYATINIVDITKTYYTYVRGLKDIYFVFEFEPKVEGVDYIKFNYSYKDVKTGEVRETKGLEYSSPLKDKAKRSYHVGYGEMSLFEKESFSSIMKKYEFSIEIETVKVNGTDVKDYIPWSVRKLMYDETDKYYRDETACLADTNHITERDYSRDKYLETIKDKDAKTLEFIEEISCRSITRRY